MTDLYSPGSDIWNLTMTEDEARTKWCPFARVPFTTGPTADGDFRLASVNRGNLSQMDLGHDAQYGVNCIASDCMAFRWLYERKPLPSDDPQAETPHEIVQTDQGYCGLAGQP